MFEQRSDGRCKITGNLNVGNNLTVDKNLTVNNDLTINGNLIYDDGTGGFQPFVTSIQPNLLADLTQFQGAFNSNTIKSGSQLYGERFCKI